MSEDPSSSNTQLSQASALTQPPAQATKKDFVVWLKSLVGKKAIAEDELRGALEDYIEELSTPETDENSTTEERMLIANILELRGMTVSDVMVPRIDIIAIDIETQPVELLALLSEKQFSRIPVYRETLDDVLGTIHIKDVLSCLAQNKPIVLQELIRESMIVSPALPVISLILQMKETRKHIAFVIDEYGGIDGLVTMGDLVESILGDIQDEHEPQAIPDIQETPDGSYIIDTRISLHECEETIDIEFSEEEKEDSHTLGGFIFALASRVPSRGEIIVDEDRNLEFEILDANPRKVNRVRMRRTQLPETN